MTATTNRPDIAHAAQAPNPYMCGAGDFGRIDVTLQITAELLCDAMDLTAGRTVLDLAGSGGNAALAAARRFCKVLSVDNCPKRLERSVVRARAEGLAIDHQLVAVDRLPLENVSFDYVISAFGIMFQSDSVRACYDLLRMTRPAGRIGLTAWTPDGFVGRLLALVARFATASDGIAPGVEWGTRKFLRNRFGETAAVEAATRSVDLRYESCAHAVDVFSACLRPLADILASQAPDCQIRLRRELRRLIAEFNVAPDGTVVLPSSYLEVVLEKRK